MKVSLRVKITLAMIVVLLAGYLFLAFWGNDLIYQKQYSDKVNSLRKDAEYIAASYKANNGNIQRSLLESIAYTTETDIWVLSVKGELLSHSGQKPDLKNLIPYTPSDAIKGYYMEGDFYGTRSEDTLSVFVPLAVVVIPQGYVVLHYPVSSIQKATDQMQLFAYIMYFFMSGLLILFAIFMDFLITRPIRKIRKAGLEYCNENHTFPNPLPKRRDELGEIARSEEELAHQLNENAEAQHKFIANISHDFRSPLTSIRGYIGAMQDGTIPPEMQDKYFGVVLNETERLQKLANGLLDMTQLENGIRLSKSSFDVNDLIREVLPTFEGAVNEKDLTFCLTFETVHQNVSADRARIQQVIYNLVDNAIKFSETGSTVDLSTKLLGDKVFVSVADHGCGIEKENLNKIWDRFYKTDSSRGRDKKGTGLGLSIVREIIQAHKEKIDVISAPNVGTEFIFSLTADMR